MSHRLRARRPLRGALATTTAVAVAATLAAGLGGPSAAQPAAPAAAPDRDDEAPTRIVMVDAPTVADRNRVVDLGLDLTEHATRKGIEVVLHGDGDARRLREAGFDWSVEVADLEAEQRRQRKADRRYAARVEESGLPSGRTSYRTYDDYLDDMADLAAAYPKLTRPLTLANQTVLGEDITGLEISTGADDVRDGKPVFLLLGAHHAREWPSAEHTMEFGIDLLQSYREGDARARGLLQGMRLVIVPVVNVDGYQISREATPLGNFSRFDYEMKRKNCSISEQVEGAWATGPCANNPEGRLRGTDLNRNYPGFWGGGGASTNPDSDTYRGDGPGSEPESDAVRRFISERAVTMMISNHTYSNLVLRPPAIASTGKSVDEPAYKALGDSFADANGYTSQASYQLYDTSGSTEDWSYWITGGFGFTFEIGPDGFHPAYEDAVVGEYLGTTEEADDRGGNREAYYLAAEGAMDHALISRVSGKAPKGTKIVLSKTHVSPTSPVIQPDGSTGPQRFYEDTLVNRYASDGGRFTLDVNPSTRPLVEGRYGREPAADPQEPADIANPAGVPEVGESEETSFEILGQPEVDNGFATLSFGWPDGADWDFYVLGPDGEPVGSGATLANPEEIVIPDPVAGTYTVVAENYEGGTAEDDWTGEVSFQSPTPPQDNGIDEAWQVTCLKKGRILASQDVVVDRGEVARLGAVCKPARVKARQ